MTLSLLICILVFAIGALRIIYTMTTNAETGDGGNTWDVAAGFTSAIAFIVGLMLFGALLARHHYVGTWK